VENPGAHGRLTPPTDLRRAPHLPAMMKTPRYEGDQEVTIPELNLTDAAKGNGNVPLLAFLGSGFTGSQRVLRDQAVARGSGDPPYSEDLWI
jgi:hypothetical protein